MGMPSGGRSDFAKFAKVTSTPGYGYIPNGGSVFLLLEQTGCQVNIVCGDLPDAEGRQNGISVAFTVLANNAGIIVSGLLEFDV